MQHCPIGGLLFTMDQFERPVKKQKQEDDYHCDYSSDVDHQTSKDFRKLLVLKPDHDNRPLWSCADGRIILDTSSPYYKPASQFLAEIAEPISITECFREYNLTPGSLYAGVLGGLDTQSILATLNMLSKAQLPRQLLHFVHKCTSNYGKVKLVLKNKRYMVECLFPHILEILLSDPVISTGRADMGVLATSNSFEIQSSQVHMVKQRCLPNGLNYPLLEEYEEVSNDTLEIQMKLKPEAQPRPYQRRCLNRIFQHGRARSGICVLPFGTGKSLVGVCAACRIKKACMCLALDDASVDEWVSQFTLWSNIPGERICRLTSNNKNMFCPNAAVFIMTYSMFASHSARAHKIIQEIKNTEWGLVVMDEVYMAPADMFRRVISIVRSHFKLGLTGRLVREDEKSVDREFLIGPKLYEAYSLDLVKEGYMANVLCAEVRCLMTKQFLDEYLKKENSSKRKALCLMNPNKFRACEFIIKFHEEKFDHKIIVLCDNVFALQNYATTLKEVVIDSETTPIERRKILEGFKTENLCNTLFLLMDDDTSSIDIPEANVIILISSWYAGSRVKEAKRLERIIRMARGKEESNAFFYSLVSTDTPEMYYSAKRQQFLIDKGYSFKVVRNLIPPDKPAELQYYSLEDQNQLLDKVLSTRDNEILTDDADGKALRKAGTSTGQKDVISKRKPKGSAKRHELFVKRFSRK